MLDVCNIDSGYGQAQILRGISERGGGCVGFNRGGVEGDAFDAFAELVGGDIGLFSDLVEKR